MSELDELDELEAREDLAETVAERLRLSTTSGLLDLADEAGALREQATALAASSPGNAGHLDEMAAAAAQMEIDAIEGALRLFDGDEGDEEE